MSDDETVRKKKVKTALDVQKVRLERLMQNPDKEVIIAERQTEQKLPKCFDPPEFVNNVWGSSAGAGSGDFHLYRAVRRRQYAREKFIHVQSMIEKKDKDFQEKLTKNKQLAEDRTAKKRAKRLKKKQKTNTNINSEKEQINNGEEDDEEMNDIQAAAFAELKGENINIERNPLMLGDESNEKKPVTNLIK